MGTNAQLMRLEETNSKFMRIEEKMAIQSIAGTAGPIEVRGVCKAGCMYDCAIDDKCLAFTFDEYSGSCKKWTHLLLILVDQAMATSYIKGISIFRK